MKSRHVRTRLRSNVRTAARARARIRFEGQVVDEALPESADRVQDDAPRWSSDR